MRNRKYRERELAKDILIIIFGGIVAYFLARMGIIGELVSHFNGNIIAIFIAGLFFTSVFTISPASVVLASMTSVAPLQTVVLWGALGALCGDLVLFFFIRDKFTDDLIGSMKPSIVKHVFKSFHMGFMKWLSPLLGAFIIASPLPDEMGLALLGMSKVKTAVLIPISFVMNMTGIYAIAWFAHIL